MAKIAIISDIHSNLEALETVIKDIKKKKIKKIYCAGDIVGYGANPNECTNIIRKLKIQSVQGNHDFSCIKLEDVDWFNFFGQAALAWTNKKLTKENRNFLKKLPRTMSKESIFFVHGSPRDPLHEYIYSDFTAWDAKAFFSYTKNNIIVVGHSHRPFVERLGTKMIFNPGSVGQPRDNNPKASYCIFDAKTKNVKICRIEYNIKKAADKIIKAGLPHFLSARLYLGR